MRSKNLVVLGIVAAIAVGGAFWLRSQRGAGGRLVIAVIPKGTTHEFWRTVHAGAMAAAREKSVEILWKGPTRESDYAGQIAIVENMLDRKVDGIVLAPTHAESLVPVIRRAKNAGVPLVVFDSGARTRDFVSFVATDNRAGGVAAARELARLIGRRGPVAMVKTQPGGASTEEREAGFRETLAREFPDVRIVAEQYGMSLRERSLAVATDILTAHPDVAGFFGSNESSTHGVMLAVKGRGLAGRVKVVGFDASEDQLRALQDGLVHALVVQNPFRMGHDGVVAVLEAIRGRRPERRVDTGVTLVTRENLETPPILKLVHPR
ncbi:MAG: substrate-binding domain-containing protein [Deltaproteobacteria bacterium]|nr:substrate-binding domain-containing protein [Deltaproteobacteria bacterium]